MKQVNVNFQTHRKTVYFSYELVYNIKVSLPLSDSMGSGVLDD